MGKMFSGLFPSLHRYFLHVFSWWLDVFSYCCHWSVNLWILRGAFGSCHLYYNKIIRNYVLLLSEHTIVSILLSMVVVFMCKFILYGSLYFFLQLNLMYEHPHWGCSYAELTVQYLLCDRYLLFANVNQVSALDSFSVAFLPKVE